MTTGEAVEPERPIFSVDDARRLARRRLPRLIFDFVDGAAGREISKAANQAALREIRLQPRVLRRVEDIRLETHFLGRRYDLPIGIAPMGMCNLIDPRADRAIVAEAVRRNMPHCLSTASSTALEEMRAHGGDNLWFQLYVLGSLELARELVDRAEAAGCSVLVLTADVPRVAPRIRDLRNGFTVPFRIGPSQFLDFALHPRWSIRTLLAGEPRPMNIETSDHAAGFDRYSGRGGIDFDFLGWLRERWSGALVVKGVMSAQDAGAIRDAGADAVWVSNHGGRQLDSAPPAVLALREVRAAVGPDYPVLFDGGVESGEDIATALALGADYVMLGRAVLYALGAGRAPALHALFERLIEELTTTMAQLGVTRIAQLDRSVLADRNAQNVPNPNEGIIKT